MPRDPYEILGVGREAGEAEIKKAFRRLARELHPDVNTEDPAAEEKFKEAAEAYEILSDPERRRTYDAFGHDGLRSGRIPFARRERRRLPGHLRGDLRPVGSRCSATSSASAGAAAAPPPGGDVGVRVRIELADVIEGVRKEVTFDAVVRCEHCHGNGAEPGTPINTCGTCDGAGPGPPGHPDAVRPDGPRRSVPDLPRRRQDPGDALRGLRRRRRHGGAEDVRGRCPGRDRERPADPDLGRRSRRRRRRARRRSLRPGRGRARRPLPPRGNRPRQRPRGHRDDGDARRDAAGRDADRRAGRRARARLPARRHDQDPRRGAAAAPGRPAPGRPPRRRSRS